MVIYYRKDRNDKYLKTFALDRIKKFYITTQKFALPQNFDPSKYFKDCYGVITSDGSAPVEIVLSFDPYQGKYIKTNPIHESQKIIFDNDTELRISLFLYITHDLIMELLSYGETVRVLKPESLIAEIKEIYLASLKQY